MMGTGYHRGWAKAGPCGGKDGPGSPGRAYQDPLSLLSVAANCDKTTERDLARAACAASAAATSRGPELPRCLCSQVDTHFLN